MPRWSPPLLPEADEAREWARHELARTVYDNQPGLLELLWKKFVELLESIIDAGGGLNYAFVPLVIFAVLAAVIIASFVLAGPVRKRRTSPDADGPVWDADDTRTSSQLRAAAAAAAKNGDDHTAVIEQFRAIVRRLQERAVLRVSDGLTASEVAALATTALPGHEVPLRGAGELFNAVHYGGASATPADYNRLCSLDHQLDATRPVHELVSSQSARKQP